MYSMLLKVITLIFMLLGGAALCAPPAVETAPDAKPEDKPKVVADQSTPAGAMLLFIRAMETGDAEAALAVAELRNDEDKEMLEAVTAATMAHAELRKAIRAKFGDDALSDNDQLKHLGLKTEYDFTDAEITETDDTTSPTAEAKLRNNRGKIGLIKVDGKWKVSIEISMKEYSGTKAAAVSKSFHGDENLAVKSMQRLKEGKYQDLSELQDDLDAMQKEINEQAKKRKAASGDDK